jgi:hypothetical protein
VELFFLKKKREMVPASFDFMALIC